MIINEMAPTVKEMAEATIGDPTTVLSCALTLNCVGKAIPANNAKIMNMIAMYFPLSLTFALIN
jgi:hypothetical protein